MLSLNFKFYGLSLLFFVTFYLPHPRNDTYVKHIGRHVYSKNNFLRNTTKNYSVSLPLKVIRNNCKQTYLTGWTQKFLSSKGLIIPKSTAQLILISVRSY